MDKQPLLQIALPVYNGQRYLAEAVESVLAQTFGDFGLLLCDNASTDATEEMCRGYVKADSRVRYVRNAENVGSSGNFSLGFKRACTSKYFKWFGDDDLAEPTYLQKCIARLEENPYLSVCHSNSLRIDENGKIIGAFANELLMDSPVAAERFYSMLWAWAFPAVWGVIRTDRMARTGLMRAFDGSDRVFMAELLLTGGLSYVREDLYRVRVHPGAYSAKGTATHAQRMQFFNPKTNYPSFMQMPITAFNYARAIARSSADTGTKAVCWEHLTEWVGHCVWKLILRRWRWVRGAAQPMEPAPPTRALV